MRRLTIFCALAIGAAAPAASAPKANLFVSKADPVLTLSIDKRFVAPNKRPQLIACDHLAPAFHQAEQNASGLLAEFQPVPGFPQFTALGVELETRKPENAILRG